eukprot:EG_transcript_20200
MVQFSDLSAPSAWYRAAKKQPPKRTAPPVASPTLPPAAPGFETEDAPRGAARKKRVVFATDFPAVLCDASDQPSELSRSHSSESSIASEEEDISALPLWTLVSFHAGPFLVNTVFASRG